MAIHTVFAKIAQILVQMWQGKYLILENGILLFGASFSERHFLKFTGVSKFCKYYKALSKFGKFGKFGMNLICTKHNILIYQMI